MKERERKNIQIEFHDRMICRRQPIITLSSACPNSSLPQTGPPPPMNNKNSKIPESAFLNT